MQKMNPHQTTYAAQLLAKYPLISDQIDKDQLQVILQELEKTLASSDGAVVEFGCYIGTTSLFIRRLLDMDGHNRDGHAGHGSTSGNKPAPETAREFHVYDSFEGLPPKTAQDQSRAGDQFQAGELAVSKKQFLQQFQKAGLQPPIVHKGWFGNLGAADIPDQIAFAFLDGDFYESIRDSLRLVLPRLQRGGIVVVDDYAREALPGAARAVHELLPNAAIRTQHNLGIVSP
jgi:O-methyltransferase